MPDVYMYTQASDFVPGSAKTDAVLLDVGKYNPPGYYEGSHGEEVKFTLKEAGIPGMRFAKGVRAPEKSREQIEEEVLVLLAEQKHAEELLVREEENPAPPKNPQN